MARQDTMTLTLEEPYASTVRRRAQVEGRTISNWLRLAVMQVLKDETPLISELPPDALMIEAQKQS